MTRTPATRIRWPWSYFGLSEVMTDPTNCGSYDWSIVDNALNEIASYGNQAAIRFYMEYPGGTGTHPGNAIPHCFDGNVTYRTNTYWGTTSPDYDSPFLLNALGNFIAAFGARYDGDPRIGFINLGLVGLWGEWHTWPFDTDTTDGYPNFMPTDAHAAQIIQAYDERVQQDENRGPLPELRRRRGQQPGHRLPRRLVLLPRRQSAGRRHPAAVPRRRHLRPAAARPQRGHREQVDHRLDGRRGAPGDPVARRSPPGPAAPGRSTT